MRNPAARTSRAASARSSRRSSIVRPSRAIFASIDSISGVMRASTSRRVPTIASLSDRSSRRDELEHAQRREVGDVKVVEHEQGRAPRARRPQLAGDGAEHLKARSLGLDRRDERRVRDRQAEHAEGLIQGKYGGAPPDSHARPHATRKPIPFAASAAASASRVLPIPGSPTSIARPPRPWPAWERSSSRSRIVAAPEELVHVARIGDRGSADKRLSPDFGLPGDSVVASAGESKSSDWMLASRAEGLSAAGRRSGHRLSALRTRFTRDGRPPVALDRRFIADETRL